MGPLAELGLEHLVPVLMRGKNVELDSDTISRMMTGLADGAKKRASRRLVAVSLASGEDLLEWEVDSAKETQALKHAALMGIAEAKEAIVGFFGSLGLSLNVFHGSLEPGEESPMSEPPSPLEAKPE